MKQPKQLILNEDQVFLLTGTSEPEWRAFEKWIDDCAFSGNIGCTS